MRSTRARERHNFALWAYVFMPDHIHLIIYPRNEEHDIGRILEAIKRPVGSQAMRYSEKSQSEWLDRLTRKRGNRTERLFWQSGGGYDRNITSPRTLLRMMDYLHEHPVSKGLVTQAHEWMWSSVGYYLGGTSPLAPEAIPADWLEVDA